MPNLKELLSTLVSFKSISPDDNGCQEYLIPMLEEMGFNCQVLDNAPVSNFFASYGSFGPLLVFAGHTDVVSPGDCEKWHSDPFVLREADDMYYGRGVADMKGSIAAMMLMAQRFIKAYPDFPGRLGFLITSGEEGDDFDRGTPYVMDELIKQGIEINYCVVGEPTANKDIGDVIKIGRRGSLSAQITLTGKQGHVAYPHLAQNPIHDISPAIAELTAKKWDEGNAYFPPTSMQITYLHSGGHASNIIPGELELHFNFRFSTEQNEEMIKNEVAAIFDKYNVHPQIKWRLNGEPFLTDKGHLLDAAKMSIFKHTGLRTEVSTSGGTSDGRFIAPFGVEVIEIGPSNATIHQVNESVSVQDLQVLEEIYFSIAKKLLVTK